MTTKLKIIGFGFMPSESHHHFIVNIPYARSKDKNIYISEQSEWAENEERRNLIEKLSHDGSMLRVIIPHIKWSEIADEVKAEFNRRLQYNGLKTGKWKAGLNPISRILGKELVLLAWAIEDSDPSLIPVAIKNWLGLAPEERWWLFTMTNAATGHAISGKGKGWRKAVRYALTENPVSSDVKPSTHRKFGVFEPLENAFRWSDEDSKKKAQNR
jgi:hypothetical protein